MLLPIPLGWVGVACWGDIWVLLVCLYMGGVAWGWVAGEGVLIGGVAHVRGGGRGWSQHATLALLGVGKDRPSGGSSSRAPRLPLPLHPTLSVNPA